MLRLISLLVFILYSTIATATTISDIVIEGNERISFATINNYIDLSKGDSFNQDMADASVKNLFDTGYFSDVDISLSGSKLIVRVVENPMVNMVAFDGNKRVDDEDLRAELSMKPRTVLSTAKLQDDINRIITVYQHKGRYSVSVEPKMIKLEQNRINLVYEIDEGVEAKIQKINFTGNESFSDSALRDVLFSKEYRWYRFFSNADVYDSDKMEYDRELLTKFYLNQGYADVKVTATTAELSTARDAFLLTFAIEEGAVYQLGQINITSDLPKLDPNTLRSSLSIKEGSVFNQDDIDQNVDDITDAVGDLGFPFSEVDVAIDLDKANKIANLTFKVRESYKMYINKINIRGNTKTLDKVVRREFKIAEGDPYNVSRVKRSKQRVENLGYFNSVEFKNRRAEDPDKMDIDVEVEETSTGSVNFAFGYNTSAGLIGMVGISEENFMGTGNEVSLSASLAQRESSQKFSFTNPYFMDKDLSAGFDIFNTTEDLSKEAGFSQRKSGLGLRMGYELTEHLIHSVRYTIARENLYDLQSNASVYAKVSAGRTYVSSIGQGLSYDRLDSRIEPTNGYILSIDQDLAGVGGDVKYIRHEASASKYIPLMKKKLVFSLKAKAGNITGYGGKHVRLGDRFMPGQNLIRGFDTGGFGPRDLSTSGSGAVGGNNFAGLSAELAAPLKFIDDSVKGLLFVDSGSSWGVDKLSYSKYAAYNVKPKIVDHKSWRASAGPGLTWKSPFGIINVSYGVPFRKEKFDEEQRFNFNFGTRF